jgi:hypothetical protein
MTRAFIALGLGEWPVVWELNMFAYPLFAYLLYQVSPVKLIISKTEVLASKSSLGNRPV